ncbi:MAG: CCA tRNA nucleotidyltransferase [Proteobacteria bacterium]|nr:CCA tRNA nucleotidyltransferase [Pseudomonadota bacterium]
MEPAGRLEPLPGWMQDPPTAAVLEALAAEGAAVRFCGGCVRDAILGLPQSDVDLATPDAPETVMRLLARAGIKVVPTGIAHGTVTAIIGGRSFEITTLRRDVETFGRHARVAFTDDWQADASRRDFTINALYADADGTLYDPFGGRADLVAGRVRFVGEARRRIEEDVLRILRFFRFHQRFGQGEPDPMALAACSELAHLLPKLSGERVRAELFRILIGPDPAASLKLMHAAAVLGRILPEAAPTTALARLAELETDERLTQSPLRRLAIVLPADVAATERVGERLRLANAEMHRLAALARERGAIDPKADAAARRRLLYRLGALLTGDLVLIAWAEYSPERIQAAVGGFRAWLTAAESWTPPHLPIGGADIVALGIHPSPRVGALLAELEAWWIDGDFQADRTLCLAQAARLVGAAPAGAAGSDPP